VRECSRNGFRIEKQSDRTDAANASRGAASTTVGTAVWVRSSEIAIKGRRWTRTRHADRRWHVDPRPVLTRDSEQLVDFVAAPPAVDRHLERRAVLHGCPRPEDVGGDVFGRKRRERNDAIAADTDPLQLVEGWSQHIAGAVDVRIAAAVPTSYLAKPLARAQRRAVGCMQGGREGGRVAATAMKRDAAYRPKGEQVAVCVPLEAQRKQSPAVRR